ncbi:MAG: GAF domain-containing sensor histidine kinase [Mahellales bacterium]
MTSVRPAWLIDVRAELKDMHIARRLVVMYKWVEDRLFKKTLDKIERAAVIYRYISWMTTSAFYLSEPRMNVLFKIGVVTALFVAMAISAKLYVSLKDKKHYSLLVFSEVIAISFLIIPTGGLNSPFIWYALNPILNAALSDRPLLCWLGNLIFLGNITILSFLFFRPYFLMDIFYGIRTTALIFVLTTVAIQLSSRILKTLAGQAEMLTQQKEELIGVNTQLEESIQHITSLYHMTEALTGSITLEQLADTFLVYAKEILKGDIIVLFIRKDVLGYQLLKDDLFAMRKDIPVVNRQAFKDVVVKFLDTLDGRQAVIDQQLEAIEPGHLLMTGITSGGCCYGALALFGHEKGQYSISRLRTMAFLGSMCGVAIDRIKSVNMHNQVLLAEEQRRISSEMHDMVSHNLFSIIYCSQQLINTAGMSPDKIKEKLAAIRDTASTAAKELRKCIYNLNNSKDINYFEKLGLYLNDLKVLNNLDIEFNCSLTPEDLPYNTVQYNIYRLIREAVGNSVRHGRCSRLRIDILRAGDDVKVLVEDNGIGFNIKGIDTESNSGLGITNINAAARAAGGCVNIESFIGKGTRIICTIPADGINDETGDKEVVGC